MAKKTEIKVGDALRFEHGVYVIRSLLKRFDPETGAPFVQFAASGEKQFYQAFSGDAADLYWVEKHQAWVVKGRGCFVNPLTSRPMQPARERKDGAPIPMHPNYDDLTPYQKAREALIKAGKPDEADEQYPKPIFVYDGI